MRYLLKATFVGLFATALLVGCGSKEETRKLKTEKAIFQVAESEKISCVNKNHVLTIGTNYVPSQMPVKEKLKLYELTEKIAKTQGKTIE